MNNQRDVQEVVRRVQRVTYGGMIVNILLSLAKGIGGFLFSSQALVADAIHSISDLVTDIAVIFGVKYWAAPADEDHPYGHGKIEALVALFIAFALAVVAYELISNAIRSLIARKFIVPNPITLIFVLFSIVSKEILFHWTRRTARAVASPALEANAWHHRSDALSSIPVGIAIAIAWFFPQFAWVDAVGAILVSLFIIRVVWSIAKPALEELIDAEIDECSKKVDALARTVPGVCDVHKVRARRYGGAFSADLHVLVSPSLSVAEGHELGHRVKDVLLDSDLKVTDAIIHVEPVEDVPHAE